MFHFNHIIHQVLKMFGKYNFAEYALYTQVKDQILNDIPNLRLILQSYMKELYDTKNHYFIIKHWQEYVCKQKICWNDRRNKSRKCHMAMWGKGMFD